MMTNFEDWSNVELARELEENDEFFKEVLLSIWDAGGETLPLWQWDRADLIQYAKDYL